jgi:hypothetical protein
LRASRRFQLTGAERSGFLDAERALDREVSLNTPHRSRVATTSQQAAKTTISATLIGLSPSFLEDSG